MTRRMKIHIKGGRLIDVYDQAVGHASTADVFIADGFIVAIGESPPDFCAEQTVDATGLDVMPGLVDLAACVCESDGSHLATLHSEMAAAVAGGVTGLVCPPDVYPMLDRPIAVQALQSRCADLGQAYLYPLGALTLGLKGEQLSEMDELSAAGCIGFSQADQPIVDTQVLLHALQYAGMQGYTAWLHAEDPYLAHDGVAASGAVATRLGLTGVPAAAETVALQTILELIRITGTRVHVPHLSTAGGLNLIRAAKQEGLPVTCDVSVYHLHLIDADIGYFNTQYRFSPPLRTQRDRDAIRAGLLDGTIDAICSGHKPLDDSKKQQPFATATPGATGLELLLPLTVKWAQEAKLPLALALAKVTAGPRAVLGLPPLHLKVGGAADICVFDSQAYWQVTAAGLRSHGRNTPMLGYEVPGRVIATWVAGHLAYGLHLAA